MKDKEPTVYVELFEADLELLDAGERAMGLMEVTRAALERNRDRVGTDGAKPVSPPGHTARARFASSA